VREWQERCLFSNNVKLCITASKIRLFCEHGRDYKGGY
jgi:hypothetical protein